MKRNISELLTAPASDFLSDFMMVYDYHDTMITIAKMEDSHLKSLAVLLRQAFNFDATKQEQYSRIIDQPGYAFKLFSAYTPVLNEMVLCRTVDRYVTYISHLLTLIFRAKPRALNPSSTIKMSMLFEYSTIEELIAAVIDQRVHELSYKGVADLSKFLEDNLGFPLFEEHEDLLVAKRIIETRNLLVHNRGFVNAIFKERIPESTQSIGERVEIEDAHNDTHFLLFSVSDIDERACEKFDIERIFRSSDIVTEDGGIIAQFEPLFDKHRELET